MKTIRYLIERSSIKNRMIASLIIILAAAFSITNYLNYSASHNSVRNSLINSVLPLTRDNIYSEIQANIIRPVFISSLMANDTFLKDWAINGEKDIGAIKKYLRAIRDKYDFFSVFFVSDRTGNYYHYNGILKHISKKDSHDVWYYNFIGLNKDYDLDVDTDQASGDKLTVFINHRLTDYNGKLLGVTGVGLNMDKIAGMLRSYNSTYNCNIYLTDRHGTIQIHPDEKVIEKSNIKSIPGLDRISESILSHTGNISVYQLERGNSLILLTTRYIPEFDWFLFVEIDEKSRMEPILSSTKTTIALGIILSVLIISIAAATVNYFQKQVNRMAVTDDLTGAYNRKEFDHHFRRAVYGFNRHKTPFSVIIFDIDNFKKINDNYGHLTGDAVIKEIARIAMESKRLPDLLVRWGGDEFILLAYCKPEDAFTAAERLRKLVAASTFAPAESGKNTPEVRTTISCGIASFSKGDTIDSLVSRADIALYSAKQSGKNRVVSDMSKNRKTNVAEKRRHK